ncbi:MAG: NADH-quinone oxidoreductase subunit NuoI [Fimbriimonadaceae bacterium]|nr:NADH-quinone oxidoreductase subunit NuoI [Fimbriimonadaceae bacterium]
MREFLQQVLEVVEPLKVGFATTRKHIAREAVTYEYPEERKPLPDRARWRHILRRHESGEHAGLERCIGCSLCSAACPAECIYVEAGQNTTAERYSPGERYATIYQINMLRCIFCGMCEDACPTGAIVLTSDFELAEYRREDFIYNKERLLVPPVS